MFDTEKNNEKINYIEFPAKDFDVTKVFFKSVFNWSFEDYGPDYMAFSNAGIDGGFFRSGLATTTEKGGALIIFYSEELEQTQTRIEGAGGLIKQAIYSFPGGRRFHFQDPNGNEFAVWSDK